MTAKEIQEKFLFPFEAGEVKAKPQTAKGTRAMVVFYIDARLVEDRLDSVVGVEGWQDEYETLPDGSVVCRLKIKLNGEWVTKMDVGSPSEQPDGGDRMKAAFSDALKRAAVKFGIGRYLYRLPQIWEDYDPQKRQFVRPPKLPHFALPPVRNPDRKPEPEPSPPAAPKAAPKPVEKPAEKVVLFGPDWQDYAGEENEPHSDEIDVLASDLARFGTLAKSVGLGYVDVIEQMNQWLDTDYTPLTAFDEDHYQSQESKKKPVKPAMQDEHRLAAARRLLILAKTMKVIPPTPAPI